MVDLDQKQGYHLDQGLSPESLAAPMVEPPEKLPSSFSSSSSEVSVKLERDIGGGSGSEDKEVDSREASASTSATGSAVNNGNAKSSG